MHYKGIYIHIGSRTRGEGGTGGTYSHKVLCQGSVPPQNFTATDTGVCDIEDAAYSLVSFLRSTPTSKQAEDERVSLSLF